MSKSRPIIFKSEMVISILEGRKTQTRRILKPQLGGGWEFGTASETGIKYGWIRSPHPRRERFGVFIRRRVGTGAQRFEHSIIPCPYGQPGDRLWVREKFATHFIWDDLPPGHIDIQNHSDGFFYSDGTITSAGCEDHQRGKWRPSIHMPRFASRITLAITDVRVERLQDISEDDAQAEGAQPAFSYPGWDGVAASPSYRWGFQKLWQSINGPDSWDANPWVWVIEFKRVDQGGTP